MASSRGDLGCVQKGQQFQFGNIAPGLKDLNPGRPTIIKPGTQALGHGTADVKSGGDVGSIADTPRKKAGKRVQRQTLMPRKKRKGPKLIF